MYATDTGPISCSNVRTPATSSDWSATAPAIPSTPSEEATRLARGQRARETRWSTTTAGSSSAYWPMTRTSFTQPSAIAVDGASSANATNIPTRNTIPAAETSAATRSARQATRTTRGADSSAGAAMDVITASGVLDGGEQRAD